MNRCETADFYHKKGYNCAQAVIWGFQDILPIPTEQVVDITAGFGGGAGTGELCGALSGGIMVLGLLYPVDHADPVASKQRTTKLSKEFQNRFQELFRHLRCHDLLKDPSQANEATPAALSMGITRHCDLMIVTAVEVLEQLLKEQGKLD